MLTRTLLARGHVRGQAADLEEERQRQLRLDEAERLRQQELAEAERLRQLQLEEAERDRISAQRAIVDRLLRRLDAVDAAGQRFQPEEVVALVAAVSSTRALVADMGFVTGDALGFQRAVDNLEPAVEHCERLLAACLQVGLASTRAVSRFWKGSWTIVCVWWSWCVGGQRQSIA
jgi:hypothetical protein